MGETGVKKGGPCTNSSLLSCLIPFPTTSLGKSIKSTDRVTRTPLRPEGDGQRLSRSCRRSNMAISQVMHRDVILLALKMASATVQLKMEVDERDKKICELTGLLSLAHSPVRCKRDFTTTNSLFQSKIVQPLQTEHGNLDQSNYNCSPPNMSNFNSTSSQVYHPQVPIEQMDRVIKRMLKLVDTITVYKLSELLIISASQPGVPFPDLTDLNLEDKNGKIHKVELQGSEMGGR
jgi:hypothetical protein